jgi:squalene cyclase
MRRIFAPTLAPATILYKVKAGAMRRVVVVQIQVQVLRGLSTKSDSFIMCDNFSVLPALVDVDELFWLVDEGWWAGWSASLCVWLRRIISK